MRTASDSDATAIPAAIGHNACIATGAASILVPGIRCRLLASLIGQHSDSCFHLPAGSSHTHTCDVHAGGWINAAPSADASGTQPQLLLQHADQDSPSDACCLPARAAGLLRALKRQLPMMLALLQLCVLRLHGRALLFDSCFSLAACLHSTWCCLSAGSSWCQLAVPACSLFVSADGQNSVSSSDVLKHPGYTCVQRRVTWCYVLTVVLE